MADDGTPTGGAQPGDGHASLNAGRTYSESDMANARRSFENKSDKAVQRREQELLERFGVESFDAIDEAISSQRSAAEKAEHAQKKVARENATLLKRIEAAEARVAELTGREHDRVAAKAIAEAAGKAKAHADLVTLKVRDRIKVGDDGAAFVVDADGNPAGETVEQLVASVVKDDPRLAAAPQHQGGGSLPPGTSPPTGPDRMTAEGRAQILGPALEQIGIGGRR